MLKLSPFPLFCRLSLALLCAQTVARAQVPPPAPPVVTSQLRQQLRAEILQTARQTDAKYSNARTTLALPLAQLGDFPTALRWARNDSSRPSGSDQLWHWRAEQLARAGKWGEVVRAADHLSRPDWRADARLFAARQLIERGARLHTPLENSRQLEALLNSAAPLLESSSPQQKAYRAYLYARGGDSAAAQRIFEHTFQEAQRADARAIALKAAKPGSFETLILDDDSARDVLSLQVDAGLLSSALQHSDDIDEISLGWWIAAARTPAEIDALEKLVANLPAESRISNGFQLSMRTKILGDPARARAQFERARQFASQLLSPTEATAERNSRSKLDYFALLAAHFLGDPALTAQIKAELRATLEQARPDSRAPNPDDIDIFPLLFELRSPYGTGTSPPSTQKLDEIAAQLQAAPLTDLQFRGLKIVAAYFYQRQQNDKLLPVAQAMLTTARALQEQERAQRAAEKVTIISPYWPQSPRVLTAIFWLQRAGDQNSAAQFARGFARNVPSRERPYAAMALTQLGFFELADQVFDPKIEIPLSQKRDRARDKSAPINWNEFVSWGDFAVMQARFRAPDAPFAWIDKLENPGAGAGVIRGWTAALFPESPLAAPYVRVTPSGSSSAF